MLQGWFKGNVGSLFDSVWLRGSAFCVGFAALEGWPLSASERKKRQKATTNPKAIRNSNVEIPAP